jgi:hypothetical protein
MEGEVGGLKIDRHFSAPMLCRVVCPVPDVVITADVAVCHAR